MTEAPEQMSRDSVLRRGARASGFRLPNLSTFVILLIVAAVLLRLLVAGVILPWSGFRNDVSAFAIWGQRLASIGPGEFYEAGYFSDYPPAYLYVLWFLGEIGAALRPVMGLDITAGLVKIPGILADGGVAWILFAYSRRFLDGRFGSWRGEQVGLVAAVVYLFNPGTIFNASVWGQVDSVGALVILASLYWLARGWTEAAAFGAVVAVLVKFQYAFVIPIVLLVGLKRHLFGRSADPDRDGKPDWLRVLTSLAVGLGSLVVIIWPFRMAVWAPSDPARSLYDKFLAAADLYRGLTVNAFNMWRNPWSGLGDSGNQWGCDSPSPPSCTGADGIFFTIGDWAVTWQLVGTVLFVAVALLALWHVVRRDDPVGILQGALLLAVAFFALPTRVHERYLFPALALAAPLILRGWRWALLYAAIALSFFANVYWVYTIDWSYIEGPPINPGVDRLPMLRDPILQQVLYSDWAIYGLSWMIVVALGFLAWRAVRDLLPRRGSSPFVRAVVASGGPVRDAAAVPPRRGTIEDAPRPIPSWLARARAWLRPDRSDPYLREPPRRLDQLDLVIVIGLVLFAFAFRLWRLDTPRAMHFDEVYHARSATEWLADWQEGWSRDVYEWTHPMLAKYLIAAGIVVADPNKVVGEATLEEPATAMAVAPQRSAFSRPTSVVFTSAGDASITARDAVSLVELASWEAPGAVASLAYDEDGERLLVGLAEGGTVTTYSLSAFLAANGQRAPPPSGPSIESGLEAVSQIDVPDSQSVILFRGPDGIAEVEEVSGAVVATSELVTGGVAYVPGRTAGDDTTDPVVVATDVSRGVLAVLDAATLQPALDAGGAERVQELPAPPAGPLAIKGRGGDMQVWVPVGALPADVEHPAVEGGVSVFDEDVALIDTAPLPGVPKLIGWQLVASIIYVAGTDAETGDPVVWTVQPIGNGGRQSVGFAAFDTTPLPGEPLAMAFDVSDHDQGDDHERLLVTTADGSGAGGTITAIDAGSNAFAWRLSGIVFGSILVGLVYLLAATMFSRRRIAVLAAAFVAVDAMSYVMSRISMNDIFVATFIAAAYLLFWQVWSGRWSRSAWWVLPLVGVLIGLAAASKWVGIYALAGIWVLVLARSALGRFFLVGAIGVITIVMGIGAPWPFLVVCIATLALALVIVWVRPIRLDARDLVAIPSTTLVLGIVGVAFSLAISQVADAREPRSAVEAIFGVLARGAQVAWPAWVMLGVAAALLVARAVVSLRDTRSDRRWHQPGELAGFAWPWIGACLAVIPLLVYFVAYIPYLQLGHNIAGPDAGPGYGWSLDELHAQMFGYHFGLQAGHVASSPWWSWPLDLKPVWFYGHDFDGRRIGVIYNGGNPVLFWAGVPALAWCAIQAWRRRSLALVLLVVAFAFQFLPWTRIERATFQYHYLTAMVLAMVAVAYVVDEALRSWTWRPFAVAFLVLAVAAGVLVFPMGSALMMPDWYINAARGLWPWNYAFQFPNPPTGDREQLFSANAVKLAIGVAVSVAAAAFALFGRDLLAPPPKRQDQEDGTQGDQTDRPDVVEIDGGNVLAEEEVRADPDQDQPQDHRPGD